MTLWQIWCKFRGHATPKTWYAPWRASTSLQFRTVTTSCERCGATLDRQLEEQRR